MEIMNIKYQIITDIDRLCAVGLACLATIPKVSGSIPTKP